MVGRLSMRGCLKRLALLNVQLVFLSLRFWYSYKMGKHCSLQVSLVIMISTFIRGLFLEPGVLVCNSGCGMWETWVAVVGRYARIYVASIGDIVLRNGVIVESEMRLPSRFLRCWQQHLVVCRFGKTQFQLCWISLSSWVKNLCQNLIVIWSWLL